MSHPIPVNTPLLSGNELAYLTQCIETGWISSEGQFVKDFENRFASFTARQYGIAVSNGSAALDIAIRALGIGKGDEVIMPAFTIISPAQSVVISGARPVLVDSEEATWNMDVEQIEAKINPATKAILVVHIYGLPVDMDPILALCRKYQLLLIEDAAEMHGQTYKGQPCGSFGDISTFSFYPNKHITTGEGGMIMCNNEDLAERCRKLRNLSFEPHGRRFIHYELGWNYRMTNLQAALGLAQLEKIDTHIAKKRQTGGMYRAGLQGLKGFVQQASSTFYAENIYWVFGLVAHTAEAADETVAFLSSHKIGTRPFFWPMHKQPVFNTMGFFVGETYPVAEKLATNGFYLPSGLGISEEEVQQVIDLLNSYAG